MQRPRWQLVPTTVEFSLAVQIAGEMAARWIPLVIFARNRAPPPPTFQTAGLPAEKAICTPTSSLRIRSPA
jgi:hypothetical protein